MNDLKLFCDIHQKRISWSFGTFGIFVVFLCIGCFDSSVKTENRKELPDKFGASLPRLVHYYPSVESASVPDGIGALFQVSSGGKLGEVLHLMRLPVDDFGVDSEVLLSVLTDFEENSKWFGGKSSFVASKSGLRVHTSGDLWAQNHDGHLLSVFAERGVPLEKGFSGSERRFLIRDLLLGEISNFSLDREIEWSLLAFALYGVPGSGWENRFGQEFTYDKCVKFLMNRRLDAASCGGTHGLYTLSAIYQVDNSRRLLAGSVREQLRVYLTVACQELLKSQAEDGSWGRGCLDGIFSSSRLIVEDDRRSTSPAGASWLSKFGTGENFTEASEKILLTSHILEWLALLGSDFEIGDKVFERGGLFLKDSLLMCRRTDVVMSFCPYSHAVRVLQYLEKAR